MEQTAPGRYVGTFPAREPGSYFVTINPGRGMAPLRTGVTVPYSDEFRDRGPNEALLAAACRRAAQGRPAGPSDREHGRSPSRSDKLHGVNTFRHDLPKATSSQEIWHWLVLLASCVFLGDVFIRRVSVNFALAAAAGGRGRCDFVLRRQPAPAQPQYIERLKSRKAEVAGQLEQIRAATRFELPAEAPADVKPLDELAPPPAAAAPRASEPSLAPEKEEEELYRAAVEGEEEGDGRRKRP